MEKAPASPKADPEALKHNLSALRLSHGLSQNEQAEILDVSPRSIQNYEAGETMLSYSALLHLLDHYGLKASSFFYQTYAAIPPSNKPKHLTAWIAGAVCLVAVVVVGATSPVGAKAFLAKVGTPPLLPIPILRFPVITQANPKRILLPLRRKVLPQATRLPVLLKGHPQVRRAHRLKEQALHRLLQARKVLLHKALPPQIPKVPHLKKRALRLLRVRRAHRLKEQVLPLHQTLGVHHLRELLPRVHPATSPPKSLVSRN